MTPEPLTINPDLLAALTPGARLRFRQRELRHIRAIVDDEYVVYKVWWSHHQRWEYIVVWVYALHLEWEEGWLRPA